MTTRRRILYYVLGITILLILFQIIIRIVRAFYKFPTPHFLVDLLDNPVRRKIQPPAETAIRHGIKPGMTVLEVGPGSGTYTIAAARRVGGQGKVVAIDIEPRIIERVQRKAQAEGIHNVKARVADVFDLPFEEGIFDLVYMITVIGEIPTPEKAMTEFYRVLSPSGTLVFSEFLWDPDYPLAGTLARKAAASGFRVKKKLGNVLYYTLILEKSR